MARVKGGLGAKKKHNRTLKLAKGYRGARSKQYRRLKDMKLVRSAFDYIYLTEIFHYISEYPFFIWGNSGILERV